MENWINLRWWEPEPEARQLLRASKGAFWAGTGKIEKTCPNPQKWSINMASEGWWAPETDVGQLISAVAGLWNG